MEHIYNVVPIESRINYGLSNGASFNDLEQPLTQFSRSRLFYAEYLING